jgi:hypothetical protein
MSCRRAFAVVPLVVLVAALTACTPSASIPPPEPTSATQPLFASDEEALDAATAAYEEFLGLSGEILRDGGLDPERIAPLVSEDVFQSEAEGFALLSDNGWKAIGESELLGIELQQHISGPPGVAEVLAYVCVSVANIDIVDQSGVSQSSSERETEVSFEIVFTSAFDGGLTIDRKTIWPESVACSPS